MICDELAPPLITAQHLSSPLLYRAWSRGIYPAGSRVSPLDHFASKNTAVSHETIPPASREKS